MKKIVVLGGGPAGMMAAIAAAERGASVTLIEQNKILGKKLLITGKGRCNVTNFCGEEDLIAHVARNPKFLYSAFAAWNAYDTYSWFESHGVPLKVERGNRVFPQSENAADIRNALRNRLAECGVRPVQDRISSISADPLILRGAHRSYPCDCAIIAAGGKSYPLTGSDGSGYALAASLGHRVVAPEPALVALRAQSQAVAELAGLSLKNVRLTVTTRKGKTLYSEVGEMLFTHTGISGPLVLTASSLLNNADFPCEAQIDLKPALSPEMLDRRVLRDFEEAANKDFSNALSKLLPRKLIRPVVARSGIAPDQKVHAITRAQREGLVYIIKNFSLELSGKCGFEEAVITAGGVEVGGVDPRTMMSRLVKNVYFAGEVLDVDAFTGGYNLQIAFSTGYLAGVSAAQEDKNEY